MEKYTIVYKDSDEIKLSYIECKLGDLSDVIKNEMGLGNVWFIFHGHCKHV